MDLTSILQTIDVGRGLILLGVLFLIIIYLFYPQKKVIFTISIAVVLAILLATVLKELIPVARPCADSLVCLSGNSFPSRHAAMFFALAFALWKQKQVWVFLGSLMIAIFVVFLKVAANQHTVFDILGGIGVALVCVVVAEKVVEFLDKQRHITLILEKFKLK